MTKRTIMALELRDSTKKAIRSIDNITDDETIEV